MRVGPGRRRLRAALVALVLVLALAGLGALLQAGRCKGSMVDTLRMPGEPCYEEAMRRGGWQP